MNTAVVRPSHRRQQMWVCIIAGLFLCDFVLCGYIPSQQRLTSLREARAEQQRTIEMAAAQGEELPRLKAKLRDTERVAGYFGTYVPVDNALGTFLQQVAVVMTENDLTDQVVLPGRELAAEDLGCIPIHIGCKGTLVDLFNFFTRLGTMDRLVRIEKVLMENDPGYTGRLGMQMDAFIYYQVKGRTAVGTDNAKPAGGAGNGT